jgi:putative heme iron utilization protein
MNADHAGTLRAFCRHFHDVDTDLATMIGIDPDGFDARAGTRVLRFEFSASVLDAQGARAALVEMAQQCRA